LTTRRALQHLRKSDPVLAKTIERVGPYRFKPMAEGKHLDALVRSIVYQQLSGKAAATIHRRLLDLFDDGAPNADQLVTLPEDVMRGAGLSRQKIGYLRDLGARVNANELPLEEIEKLSDAEIEAALVSVKGIGRWTAQMFLMFRLGRPDVLPESDLGIRKGVMRAYKLRKLPTPARVKEIGAPWSPYASVASWYLWRVLEVE
jgi:DNA-3-methyladenine glycosylase II